MTKSRSHILATLMVGVSLTAIAIPQQAAAQTAALPAADPNANSEIIVTGIRGSLRTSRNIKRDSQGVVDAISAEDIGKFPDTNLAESLQRITGVSIDRSNGEGSSVTVRGFGPDFNLVLLNGRQMPASGLGGGGAPASRSFDFGNLASEGIAAVEVYKSGRAALPTGGIGSVINIKTARPLDRPGLKGSFGFKAVYDTSRFSGSKLSPEISGIISDTFADDKIGILVSGSYQRRKSSQAQFNAGWREGYLGSDGCQEGNWGALAAGPNDWCGSSNNIVNRPKATDSYQTTQNAGYDFTDVDRKRINGQLVLQAKPTENLLATVDYTFSQNTVDSRTSSIGVWFNHSNTSSSWTDGPAASPNFYSEVFGPGKDLAITGAVAANRSTNRSIGGNLAWHGLGGARLELDAHHSTAESKPTSPYGSNIAVGSAIFGVQSQKVDYTHDMPVISVVLAPGSELNAANIRPAGNAFRNAYMRDRINQVSLKAGYDFDTSFIKSLDFGATLTDNKVRSAFGNIQNDTWGGTLSAADTPDNLYSIIGLPDRLSGMEGSNDPAIIPNYFQVDTVGLINLLQSKLNICGASATPGACLANYTVDRRIREKSIAPYAQTTHEFNLFSNPSHLRLGVRYERTKVSSSALVPVPTTTFLAAFNEISIIQPTTSDFTTLKGEYKNWLPAVDFDVSPMRDFKLRAAYSHTITRADYASLQGGLTVVSPARPNGGSTGASGNPNLLPYKSKNIDLSAEWYYGRESYVSIGFFHKTVSNFIGTTTTQGPVFGLTNPGQGAAFNAAKAALGPNATFQQILAYVQTNYPALIHRDGNNAPDGILSSPSDPALVFTVGQPGNSDQVAHLKGWEFAIQHSFWNTGFGAILNYTIVKSDTQYDNAKRYTVTQFAVPGVSNSANAVLFYDKGGLQARVAYNWRAGFLAGYGLDPFYVNSYGQFDASASYEVRKGLTVFAEGINLTNADRSGHMRGNQAKFFAAPGYARYAGGVRYSF
ncbi:TonB-dependent receptor [Sphingomonas sp.]|uniref:TonB-dependent receptor n=1 Tax=Sphingomonas sp. TaxID=28214 RepID=UPI0025D8059D|nr:TonB-dependent receptor [Sphingomonas sp.]